METNAQLLYNAKAKLGEGAIWSIDNKALYWVDILGRQFNIFDPATSANKTFGVNKMVGTVVPINRDNVLLALEDGMAILTLSTGNITYKLNTDIHTENKRFNDGKCDPQGRFWVGSLSLKDIAGVSNLYCVGPNFNIVTKIDGVSISNGIAWAKNGQTMYYTDTPTRQIVKYNFDARTGNISNKQVIITIPDGMGYPDGMTIDDEDMLWIALWDGFCVVRYNPNTAELLQKINIPAPKVTSCAFGGDQLNQLYITTASCEMEIDELQMYPLSGALFVAEVNARGLPANQFKMA